MVSSKWGLSFTRSKWGKAVVYAFVLFGLVLGMYVLPGLTPAAQAHGSECFTAYKIEKVYRDGSWHWRAVANLTAPVDTRIEKWHVHGKLSPQLWPNSVTETYGKGYIYFSWRYTNPPVKASWYSICHN